MYRNIFLVGGWTIASRLTGFLRDMALAALMGGGALNDAYVAAIKLPNQFRQIFGEGSFNAAYLPTYTRVLKEGGREEADKFASHIFTLLILSQIALLGLVYLDMPLLVRLTSPGFVSQPDKFAQAVAMSRIMFPYIAFIAVFALHQGTLNANNAWGVPAFAPVAANICMIAFLAFAAFFPNVSPGVASMASWGFLISGVAQLAIVMAAARRRGLLERLTWPRWTPRSANSCGCWGRRSAFQRATRSARSPTRSSARSYPPAGSPPSATPTGFISCRAGSSSSPRVRCC